jgi:hypothetical protein|nr:MAG TPA: tail fiber assembly protein [Caudoviricetes sp.]
MLYINKFKLYEPSNAIDGVLYLKSEDEKDWYEIQSQFSKDTLKVVFDDSGLIISCSRDASLLFPVDCGVLEVESETDDLLGCYVVNGNIIKEEKPSEYHKLDGSKWVVPQDKQAELFTDRKDKLLNKLANKADKIKSDLLVGYPQTEIESFYRQEKEALAWQANNKADTPMLKQIARIRNIPFDVLVQKVLAKSGQFAIAIGVIIGQRQAFEDRLLALKTPEELTSLEKEIEEWKFQVN